MTQKQATWLGRSVAIVTLLGALVASFGFVSRVAGEVAKIPGLVLRVERLEGIAPPLLYMTCVSFGENHPPKEVPQVCSSAVANPGTPR